jgi:hypothetical protein
VGPAPSLAKLRSGPVALREHLGMGAQWGVAAVVALAVLTVARSEGLVEALPAAQVLATAGLQEPVQARPVGSVLVVVPAEPAGVRL